MIPMDDTYNEDYRRKPRASGDDPYTTNPAEKETT